VQNTRLKPTWNNRFLIIDLPPASKNRDLVMENHLISRAFSLYAELLQLHGDGSRMADWLSGAAYRIRNLEEPVTPPMDTAAIRV